MSRLSPRLLGLLALSAAGPAVTGRVAAADAGRVAAAAGSAWLVALVEAPPPRDGISPQQAAEIDRAIDSFRRRVKATAAETADGVPLFPFFPQAGVLGRDLFLNNYTDQDPAVGLVRDWDCSDYTYDGHQGHDSLIRSFREQAIGVPVFAVLPGTVVDVHDGEPDMNTALQASNRANYVILDHGGGYTTFYLHLKAGSVAVVPDQVVAAGTQLGLTASSGFSNWPHLHLETRKDNRWVEPSAGPCRAGDSLWLAQQEVGRDSHVADVYLSRGAVSFEDIDSYLRDETPRAGSFAKGRQLVGARIDMRNLAANAAYSVRVLDPRRKLVAAVSGAFANRATQHLGFASFGFDLDLQTLGTWRVVADVEGMEPIDAPFKVVAGSGQLGNRKPNKVTATMVPAKPVAGRVLTCTVQSSSVTEDPDYDVVGYRYDWRVGNQPVRSVTSAALSDVLAADVAQPGERVTCKVTPSDLTSSGPSTTAVGRNAP